MKYKALVFDFFGVVCSEISPFWFKEYLPEDSKELKHQYLHPADRGDVSQEELFNELSELSGQPALKIERDWESRACFNTEVIDLIKDLRGEYKIGLLSNSMAPLFHTLAEQIHVSTLFDEIAVSSEIGHAKPELEAYEFILNKLGILPEEAIMIDDTQVNIDAAVKVGMAGHLFTSVQELKTSLRK